MTVADRERQTHTRKRQSIVKGDPGMPLNLLCNGLEHARRAGGVAPHHKCSLWEMLGEWSATARRPSAPYVDHLVDIPENHRSCAVSMRADDPAGASGGQSRTQRAEEAACGAQEATSPLLLPGVDDRYHVRGVPANVVGGDDLDVRAGVRQVSACVEERRRECGIGNAESSRVRGDHGAEPTVKRARYGSLRIHLEAR